MRLSRALQDKYTQIHTPLAHMHATAVTGYVMFSGRCGKGLQPSSPAQHVCHDQHRCSRHCTASGPASAGLHQDCTAFQRRQLCWQGSQGSCHPDRGKWLGSRYHPGAPGGPLHSSFGVIRREVVELCRMYLSLIMTAKHTFDYYCCCYYYYYHNCYYYCYY